MTSRVPCYIRHPGTTVSTSRTSLRPSSVSALPVSKSCRRYKRLSSSLRYLLEVPRGSRHHSVPVHSTTICKRAKMWIRASDNTLSLRRISRSSRKTRNTTWNFERRSKPRSIVYSACTNKTRRCRISSKTSSPRRCTAAWVPVTNSSKSPLYPNGLSDVGASPLAMAFWRHWYKTT